MSERNVDHAKQVVTLQGAEVEIIRQVMQGHIQEVSKVYGRLGGSQTPEIPQLYNVIEQPAHNEELAEVAMDASDARFEQETDFEPVRFGIKQDDGQIIEVDLTKFPPDHQIHELVRQKVVRPIAINAGGQFEFKKINIKDQLPASFSDSEDAALEGKGPGRKISRKAKIIAASAVAASLGLGATAFAFPDLIGSEKSTAASLPAANDTSDILSTEMQGDNEKLSARDIAIGDCLDDSGEGKALTQGVISIDANMQWKIKTIAGKDAIIKMTKEDKTIVYPKFALDKATVNLAACIPSDVRNDAVTLDGSTVKINWDKIDRQIGIVPDEKQPTTEVWDTIEAIPGVTDQATVADLIKNMSDATNTPALAASLAEKTATDMINADKDKGAKTQTALQDQLIKDINARVAGLYAAKKSQIEKVNVEFMGTPKPLSLKIDLPTESQKFTVSDVVLSQYEPKTDK